MELIGRLHPLLLHLPIGILLYAFMHWVYIQVLAKENAHKDLSFALLMGALSAVFSAVSGWFLAKTGGYDEVLLNWHKYLGIATAFGALLLVYGYRKWPSSNWFGGFFAAFIALLTLTGHYGGTLTHGEGFLTQQHTPATTQLPANIEEAHLFNELVMPIVQRKCLSCHNPQKAKGDLLLNTPAGWTKGGENGTIIKAGLADESTFITRLHLPKEDDLHMPPSGKLQLTKQEKDFLAWWVNNMQHYEHRVGDFKTTANVDAYLASLQERSGPKIDRPTEQQLLRLTAHGLIANLLSQADPWIEVRPAKPDSFAIAGLKKLRSVAPAVQAIDLSHTQITDEDLTLLNRFEHLEKLNLSHCQINGKGLAKLSKLSHLKSLNLYGTNVDTSVFESLSKLVALRKVYLWRTPVASTSLEQWRTQMTNLEIIGGVDFSQFGSPQLVPPAILAEQDLFTDSLEIELETKANRAIIKYSLDGSTPSESSLTYTEPFYVQTTTEVKAILVMEGWEDSEVIARTFAKSRYPIAQLSSNVAPNEKYAAEGVNTLIDLQKGSAAFADGKWLGFYGEDVRLTADLGAIQEVSGITIGTLADFNSYIHLPTAIRVSVSTDGRHYTNFQEKELVMVNEPAEVQVHNHFLSNVPVSARYIQIEIANQKVNPSWHPAPGATCWLFVDEILVE